jgi:hypothetical chaperone protein
MDPVPAFGLDFGTTNSAIARVGPSGIPELATYLGPDGEVPTFRSLLYFDREDELAPVEIHAGPGALIHYLEREEHGGRLVQSLKSFLATRLFSGTQIYGRMWRLEQLIGQLVGDLREQAERDFGEPVRRAVVGRPVHFVGATDEAADQLAEARLRASLTNAGFQDVEFEYEPVGAAYHYERELDHDEMILIADFGGGTSDFSLLRVGPSFSGAANRQARAESILGHDGVGVAGDAFDGKIIRHRVTPLLGRGSQFESMYGRVLPVPSWIYQHLERWHHVSFLKSRKTLQLILDLRSEAIEPEKLDALLKVVENDLGFALYRATEATKRTLSTEPEARFHLLHDEIEIDEQVTRVEFEEWIGEELAQVRGCVDRLLDATRIEPAQIDRVFLTGGSSFVPAVRDIFAERFGAEKLRMGEELTSVANGLALCAAQSS